MLKILVAVAVSLVVARRCRRRTPGPPSPSRMIAPFPPGGVADIVGRPLAASMEKTLKQPVLVVNRSGAGGAVGTTAVAKSAPDGYTILMSLSSISVFPVSDPMNGKPVPYQLSDFAPIALVTADPTVLVVAADGPYKTIQDFIASAKAYPNQINYSSAGMYSTLHVAMEMFAGAAGIKLFHIPYQGGGPAVAALLGGQVHALASGPAAAVGQIKARQDARARGLGRQAAGDDARAADVQGAGLQGRRVLHLVGRVRAGGDPGADRRIACAMRCAPRSPIRSSRGRWRKCRRRSAISMRPNSRASSPRTRRGSRSPSRRSRRRTKK